VPLDEYLTIDIILPWRGIENAPFQEVSCPIIGSIFSRILHCDRRYDEYAIALQQESNFTVYSVA